MEKLPGCIYPFRSQQPEFVTSTHAGAERWGHSSLNRTSERTAEGLAGCLEMQGGFMEECEPDPPGELPACPEAREELSCAFNTSCFPGPLLSEC